MTKRYAGGGSVLLEKLFPKVYCNSIYDIDFEKLKKMNIKGIIFDIDNTLAPFDIKYPDDKTKNFLIKLTNEGFKVSLVSNNKGNRVQIFNEELKLPAVSKAGKPRLGGLMKAMELMQTKVATTAFVGDQIFTDVWAGNRMGVHTILVKPICERDEWTVRLKRGFEKKVLKIYLKKEKEKNNG